MSDLKIGRLMLGICQTNCYFVYREGTKDVIFFDPADKGDYIYETLQGKGFQVKGILLTHAHFDHIWGCNRLRELSGAPIYAYERIPANVVGDGRTPLKELIMKKNARARAKFEELTLGEIERQTLSAQGLKLDSVIARGIQVLLRYDATYATGSQSYEVLDEIDPSYVTDLKRIAQLLKLADGALDVVIPNIYQPFEAEAEQLIFLNAHATPTLALHEYVLLEPEKRPLAKKLVERFK